MANIRPGQLLNQRYLLKRDRTFLDTKPGILPESLPELPDFLLPYLHLSTYPLHTPRPYSVMRTPDDDYVLMLESSALSTAAHPGAQPGEAPLLLPQLTKRWAEAPPLRQLGWLWQIAQVWDAFASESIASTLVTDSLLRVDGSILRLLALASEPVASPTTAPVEGSLTLAQPTLMDLGRFWQPLAETAHQAVRAFLKRLCERLERQQLTAEQLTEQLSQAIGVCGQGQVVTYDLAVYTDQGPTRKRNEDACYPASGSSQSLTSDQTRTEPQLLIVCDGIGGHQGGDVASKLAIATIESRLVPLLDKNQPELSATDLSLAIEAAICAANDEISAQNDQAQRQARDRMGTTLVMALVKGSDVFIAHLGDSRAYRIGQRNCQQVTLDDDVASRQVRLGGSLYREVLPQPGSGSLIQALGMGPSQTLRPTVQRFVLDENCVFLLCSDELSDSDRVEQFWQPMLRPLVVSDGSTAEVGKHLVDLANKYNGHDNVTVGLLNAQVVRPSDRIVPRELSGAAASAGDHDEQVPTSLDSTAVIPAKTLQPRANQTRLIAPIDKTLDNKAGATAGQTPLQTSKSSRSNPWPKLGLAVLLLAALGGLLYSLFPGLSDRFTAASTQSSTETETRAENSPEATTVPGNQAALPAPADLTVRSYLRIRQSDIPGISSFPAAKPASEGSSNEPGATVSKLALYPNPKIESDNDIAGTIPTGGIVRVMGKQSTGDGSTWVQLKLCSIPSGASIDEVPTETDAASEETTPKADTDKADTEPPSSPAGNALNTPESTETNLPLILSPGNEGWIVESKIAAVSENIQDLEPSQSGTCED